MDASSTFRRWQEPVCSRSWLVCLDLQREYVVPGRPLYHADAGEVADVCVRVIERARAGRWHIVHAHRRKDHGLFGGDGLFAAPIEGLRPLISEPIFVRPGLSAFANPDFAAELRQARGGEVYLIGFSLSGSCLATALAAADEGLSVNLVTDAVGAGPASAAAVVNGRDLLEPLFHLVSSRELEASALELAP